MSTTTTKVSTGDEGQNCSAGPLGVLRQIANWTNYLQTSGPTGFVHETKVASPDSDHRREEEFAANLRIEHCNDHQP